MDEKSKIQLAEELIKYCETFNVPIDFLFEILEDQKVTPMIRGKAMEYNAFLNLVGILPNRTWSVDKLNLNAQNGVSDEDISITHRRTGIILKVESKSAVRSSFRIGERTKIHKVPHFKVKCHRSRSNISLAEESNDRYSVDSFDVLISSPINSFFEGNTVGEGLELLSNRKAVNYLKKHFSVDSDDALIKAGYNNWIFCDPYDIEDEGFIPRTPYVLLNDDPSWKPLTDIESTLIRIVESKRNKTSRRHIKKPNTLF